MSLTRASSMGSEKLPCAITFSAHKADKHMSLATLKTLMGHKKKETTLKYIHVVNTSLRETMLKTQT